MKRGRAIQLAVVALAVAGSVAYSISGHDVVARPRLAIAMVTAKVGATVPIAIEDRGDAAVAIDSTHRAASCDPEVTATPGTFALDGFDSQAILVHCAPLPTASSCTPPTPPAQA